MKVEDLLNPISNQRDEDEWKGAVTQVPQSPSPPKTYSYTSTPRTRGHKQPKDAPIFRKGPTKGDVQFPPYEAGNDEELAEQHQKFQVYPMGEIAEHCHHIPYSSDKKTFLSKTGRDAFEVFQYTFRLPNEEKPHTVMWDYNIGLVRITPFFKSCKYSKTTPAKVLNINPGLRDISHSITGGALAAQGYWMPFECAKAVAATFCYNVRFALTPLFGKSFLDLCLHPDDPKFGHFKINCEVVRSCTAETQKWLLRNDARLTPASSREPSEAPGTPMPNTAISSWKFKQLQPKLVSKDASPESGYGTDTDWSNTSMFSPKISPKPSPKSTWTSVNRPRTPLHATREEVSAAEALVKVSQIEPPRSVKVNRSPNNKKTIPKRPLIEFDENHADDEDEAGPENERKKPQCSDFRAAYMLMQLNYDTHGEKRPRIMSA